MSEKKKRDLISEIISRKNREGELYGFDYESRFTKLEIFLDQYSENDESVQSEFLKYIPIATIACFEAFFSHMVSLLIDGGKPFRERVAAFNQSRNIKLDFEVLAAIQQETLTLGDFVSHALSYSSLAEVNANISTLLGEDFLSAMKKFERKSIFEETNKVFADFKAHTDQVIKSVNKTYELRHIFAHEYSLSTEAHLTEIRENFAYCKLFLDQAYQFLREQLYPNSPETQTDMNISSYESFEKTDAELEDMLLRIRKASIDWEDMDWRNMELFEKSITAWQEYRMLSAEYAASCVEGGSLYPTIYAGAVQAVTLEKIQSLRKEFSNVFKQNT